MNATVENLFQAALALPPADRQALTEALLAVADHPEGPTLAGEAYIAEIQRRSAQTEAEAWVPWTEIRQRVHARLGLGEPNHG